jgi:hypothetical protein
MYIISYQMEENKLINILDSDYIGIKNIEDQ